MNADKFSWLGRVVGVAAACIYLAGAAGVAQAHDAFAPAWRGQPGSMWAEWDTWTHYPLDMPPDNGAWPDLTAPTAQAGNTVSKDPGKLGIWGEWALSFVLDNYAEINPNKIIRVQITWRATEGYAAPGGFRIYRSGWPVSGTPEEFINLLPDDNLIIDEDWNASMWEFTLDDNPDQEVIQLNFYDPITGDPAGPQQWAWVDQVVIDTFCCQIPIPEPGTISLLTLGGLTLIRRRRNA